MSRKIFDRNALFQPLRGAEKITGLSEKYIRQGCISGEIPHIKVGSDYRVNMELFLKQLNEISEASRKAQ